MTSAGTTGILSGDMPLTPALPAPLVSKAKVIIKALARELGPLAGLLTYETESSAPEDVAWDYVVLRWSRATPGGTAEDYAQIGFNIVNITGGDLDASWTTGDYTAVETALNEWWTTVKASIDDSHTLVDYRHYQRSFANPMTADKRFAEMGPPRRITTVGTAGTNVQTELPYQVAMSVTLKTPLPRHWGRVYLPGMASNKLGTNGRWASTPMSAIANATAELMDDLNGGGYFIVVPVTQISSVLTPALLNVTDIVVDDIPDVIRRRRPRQAAARTVGAPTP